MRTLEEGEKQRLHLDTAPAGREGGKSRNYTPCNIMHQFDLPLFYQQKRAPLSDEETGD